jgi:hypothetical protein
MTTKKPATSVKLGDYVKIRVGGRLGKVTRVLDQNLCEVVFAPFTSPRVWNRADLIYSPPSEF